MALLKSLLTLWVWKVTRPVWAMFSKLKASVGLEKSLSYHFQHNAKDDNFDNQDPQFFYVGKKSGRRPCHWTIYQELCQLFIRAVQSLLCWIMWRSLIPRLSYM